MYAGSFVEGAPGNLGVPGKPEFGGPGGPTEVKIGPQRSLDNLLLALQPVAPILAPILVPILALFFWTKPAKSLSQLLFFGS